MKNHESYVIAGRNCNILRNLDNTNDEHVCLEVYLDLRQKIFVKWFAKPGPVFLCQSRNFEGAAFPRK